MTSNIFIGGNVTASRNVAVNGNVTIKGQSSVGPAAKPLAAPASAPTPTPTPPQRDQGVSISVGTHGVTQTSDSGMVVNTTESGREITLPSGERLSWNDQGVSGSGPGGGALKPELTTTQDGLQLVSFHDAEQNTVQVDPQSLTFEVLNKHKNLAQVYHPDGQQEVIAFGQFRDPSGKVRDYEHRAVYDPSGQMVGTEGFDGLAVDGRKLTFDLGNGVRGERTLARPLPGQGSFAKQWRAPESSAPAASSSAPLTIMEDLDSPGQYGTAAWSTGPLLLTGPSSQGRAAGPTKSPAIDPEVLPSDSTEGLSAKPVNQGTEKQPQSGVRPNFWQRMKSVFTGENPWQPNGPSSLHHRPYPTGYHQVDPFGYQQTEQMTQSIMMQTMVMGMLNQMSMMSMMFYPSPFGMFF